jgi:mannosyltransferase OCH1-like enzyme
MEDQQTYYFFSFIIVFWILIFSQYSTRILTHIEQTLLLFFIILSVSAKKWQTVSLGVFILLWFYWNNTREQITNINESRKSIEMQNKREKPMGHEETIPKNIIQIWAINPDSPRIISKEHQQLIEKWKTMNPDYRHIFMTETEIYPFLQKHYPNYLDTYNKLPRFIQKLDFLRYVALYHYGGFYFDADVEPLKPLDDTLLKHRAVFPIDQYVRCGGKNEEKRMTPFCDMSQKFLLGQYAFACQAKNPFIHKVVEEIHKNVDKYVEMEDGSELYVYITTGPDFITNVYTNYEKKDDIFILDNGREQWFGDYGRHGLLGSWK